MMRHGYIRVSVYGQAKDGNSVGYQERKLREAGAEQIYKDIFTGENIERPQFDKFREVVCSGDIIIFTRLDRFARSLVQASDMITKLIERDVSIQVLGLVVLDNSSESILFRNLPYPLRSLKEICLLSVQRKEKLQQDKNLDILKDDHELKRNAQTTLWDYYSLYMKGFTL